MRLVIIIMLFSLIYTVSSKNNVKSLTESMGQEVIEIGTPIKELPMGLEEEPSGENDEDEKEKSATNTVQSTSKKDSKKTTLADLKKSEKDNEKIDAITQDDEEARIEKELADIYKDTADYKSDSAEEKDVAKETQTESTDETTEPEDADKPIARQKNYFKFEPNSHSSKDVERFRTSIDDISCGNRQKLSGTAVPPKSESNKAFNTVTDAVALISAMLCYTFLCT